MGKMEKLLVVKIGGDIIENQHSLVSFLADFSKIKEPKILIHGGGKSATQLANQLGVDTEMVDGRRVTSAENLDIVVMTYAGLLNKKIVAGLQKHGGNALGLTGADANTILAKKRAVQFIDYGYVGDIIKVNTTTIKGFLDLGIVPVFCAVTHDANGQLLNTNADTIASEIASAMSEKYEVSLLYCFEFKGVLQDVNDENSVIEHINLDKYEALREAEIIKEGMLPKLQNCFMALQNNVSRVHIANTEFLKDENTKCTTLTL